MCSSDLDQMMSLYDQMPSVREKRLRAEMEELRIQKDEALAEKDAELVRLKELLERHHIPGCPGTHFVRPGWP